MKRRLDQLLVDRGLVESRSRAQALVMAGLVYSGERRLEKAGQQVAEDMAIELRGQDHPWVSRGGLKLAHALSEFAVDPSGAVGLDVGASTGGFTDVLLAHGPRRSTRWTSATANSPGSCAPTPAWWCWRRPTPVI